MDEGDAPAAGTPARNFVDEPVAGLPAALERRVEIGDPIADVMNAGTPPLQESGDWPVLVLRREELDLGFTEGKRHDVGAIGRLGWVRRKAEHLPIEGGSGVEVGNRYPYMRNARGVGHSSLLNQGPDRSGDSSIQCRGRRAAMTRRITA